VRYLVEEINCDVECRNTYGITPLHDAAAEGRLDIVQYLISERGCDPMSRSNSGGTPLHQACGHGGSLDVVKYMIEDVKVDSSCRDEDDATPLHIAATIGDLSVVKALVEDYLCDPYVKDKNGETPADWAENHTHITSYLSSIEKTVSTDLRRALVRQLKRYTRKATPTGAVLGNGTTCVILVSETRMERLLQTWLRV
jgi:ankyrin repeat protein